MFKKFTAIILGLLMLLQSLPAMAFSVDDFVTEEEMRQAVRGDARWVEQFPQGLFNLLGTQFEMYESNDFLEIPIVRQGGTQGKVSVDFKVIDISAEYGVDYVIRVYENARRNEIKKTNESRPLVENNLDNNTVNISQYIYPGQSSATDFIYGDNSLAVVPEPGPVQPSATEHIYYTELPKTEVTFDGAIKREAPPQGGALRQAREAYLGQKSDRPDWQAVDEGQVEELKEEYDLFLERMPGTESTLEFAEDEYIKYIYIVPLNDKLSESEEQIMLALERPKGGASRGEFYMGYVNIKDDEDPEDSLFEITTPNVAAEGGIAKIKVCRTGGINQYASVTVGTEEGSAKAGEDYEPGLAQLLFTPGMTEQNVLVNVPENPDLTTTRSFTVALDRENKNVKGSGSEAVVTIPAGENAPAARLQSRAMMVPTMMAAAAMAPAENTNAEKITPQGHSPAKGQWALDDNFLQNNITKEVNIKQLSFTETGFTFSKNNSAGSSAMVSFPVGLGGVNGVSFDYVSPNSGKSGIYYDSSYYLEFANGQKGNVIVSALSSKIWKDTWELTFKTNSSSYSSTFNNVLLRLHQLDLQISAPSKLQRKQYTIENSELKSIAEALYNKDIPKEYSPGSLYISRVYSNVGNYQEGNAAGDNSAFTTAKVYRSDNIAFGYRYSEDNPDGKYAQFAGFEVKAGGSWLQFPDQRELVLNADFFRKTGIAEEVYNAQKILVRPIFKKRPAYFSVFYNQPYYVLQNGRLKNFRTGDTSGFFINSPDYQELRMDFADIYVGDVITGLEAENYYVAKPPLWNSMGAGSNFLYWPAPENIIVTEPVGKTKIDYVLEHINTSLGFEFKAQTLIVQAHPNTYKHGITTPQYMLDGISYNRESFAAEMERVYLGPDLGEDPPILAPKNANPQLEMAFSYQFNPEFPDPSGMYRNELGKITAARLKVYDHNDPDTVRYQIDIPYNNGSFKFSGNPKDLGWELDDFATVTIFGDRKVGSAGRTAQSQEIVIDFLRESRDGIVVLPPEIEDSTQIWQGDIQNKVIVNNANPNPRAYYRMQALTSPGFVASWRDRSNDYNGDGNITDDELKKMQTDLMALGGDPASFDRNIYWGNSFTFRPWLVNPAKIYYSLEKPSGATTGNWLNFSLSEIYSTVLNPDTQSDDVPIKDAEVYVGGKQIFDGAVDGIIDGKYQDYDFDYAEGNHYLGQLLYKGQIFNFAAEGGYPVQVQIFTSDLMRPHDFKVYVQKDASTLEDQLLDKKKTFMTVPEAPTTFKYRINSGKAGVKATDSIIRIYDGAGKEIYEDYTGRPNSDGEFSYTIADPFATGIKSGGTVTLAGVFRDADGKIVQEYPEVRTGLTFMDELSSVTALASFEALNKPTLSMIGTLANKFDLGREVKFTEEYIADHLTIYDDIHPVRKVIYATFGYSDVYVKKFKENTKGDKIVVTDYGYKPDDDDDDDSEDEKEKSNLKDLEEESADDDSTSDVAQTVEENQKNPDEKNNGGGDFKMKYSISLALALEVGQEDKGNGLWGEDGHYYFSALTIMATANASYTKSNTFMTPVGIPVKVTLEAGGNAAVVLGIEANHKDPYNVKYQLNPVDGKMSLNPKNYDVYAKFYLTPYVELSAGSGFDYLELSISGRADLDFNFNAPIFGDSGVSNSGSGGLTISAKLKLKVLLVTKSWTLYKSKHISLFSSGRAQGQMLGALRDPYQDYLYEAAGTISPEDVMSRDYFSAKGGWNSDSRMQSVRPGAEQELQKGVFPYPQTKMIKIDDERTLLLFIEDDGARDSYNRASLYYAIVEDGIASDPVAIDVDGTWDENPDAFRVDNKILITWSDAGRQFIAADTHVGILSAMNISGAWFDPAAESCGPPFAITQPAPGGDTIGDINPKISYDPTEERLMVYYNKTDYAEPDEDDWNSGEVISEAVPHDEEPDGGEKALYGDIINGYSAIAYRYADYTGGSFVWDDTTVTDMIYGGERFLDLAPAAEITETERMVTEDVIITGDEGYTSTIRIPHPVTDQTVSAYEGMLDPRVVAFDLTTHNGKAIFAYILDYDSNLKTPHDQGLYIQTYDYAAEEFSYPIEIANNEKQDTQPQFAHVGDQTYLYWLQNDWAEDLEEGGFANKSKIVYTNVSELFKPSRLVKKTIGGKTFYLIDKSGSGKDGHIQTAVTCNNPIEEYHLVTNGDDVYALWTELNISHKNGVKPDDKDANDPANIHKEMHIFAACALEDYPWSQPVQLTADPGQSFSDLSFIVHEDSVYGSAAVTAAYARYVQHYDDEAGHFSDDQSVRTLALRTFFITNEPAAGELTLDAAYPGAGETVYVQAVVQNTGLHPEAGYDTQFYVTVDGEPYYESKLTGEAHDQRHADLILGGSAEQFFDSFVMPDNLEEAAEMILGFRVRSEDGNVLTYTEKEIPLAPDLVITELESLLIGENQAYTSLYVTNNGNKAFDQACTVRAGNRTLHTQPVTLAAGETQTLNFEYDITGAAFDPLMAAEDGSKYDALNLTFKFGEFEGPGEIKRVVSAEAFDELQNIQSFSITKNGTALANGTRLYIGANAAVPLAADYTGSAAESGLSHLDVKWNSSNPAVATVLKDGTLIPLMQGTTNITATLQPYAEQSRSYDHESYYGDLTAADFGVPFELVDTSYLLPEGLTRKVSLQVTVGAGSNDSGGSNYTPPVVPVSPAPPASDHQEISLTIGQNTAIVNGVTYTMDAIPFIDKTTNRTMMPARFISEILGAQVEWDNASRQVKITQGSTVIILTLNSGTAFINGKAVQLDQPAVSLPPGRTFVPLRFIAEALGAAVEYDEVTGQILITKIATASSRR